MKKVQVQVLDFEPYRQNFSLWSVIRIRVDDRYFPHFRWNDATTSVLIMWLNQVERLVYGCAEYVILPFMDGDYSIKLTQQSERSVEARFIGPNDVTVDTEEIDLLYFGRQLLSASEKLLVNYSAYEHRELQELSYRMEKLRIAIKQHRGVSQSQL